MNLESNLKIFKCPQCDGVHSISEWDDNTIKTCNNRKVRRHFRSLAVESSRDVGSSRTYVCPSCNKFVAGKKITVIDII